MDHEEARGGGCIEGPVTPYTPFLRMYNILPTVAL